VGVAQTRRIIHDNDVERLKQLLAKYPALLSWKDDDDDRGLLEWPRVRLATPATRRRNSGSPAEHAQSY